VLYPDVGPTVAADVVVPHDNAVAKYGLRSARRS